MASCIERLAAAALLVFASGCVSGHLLDAGRRRELPVALHTARLDGNDLLLSVRTRTVTDLGRPAGTGSTHARIPIAELADEHPVDAVRIRFLRTFPRHAGRTLVPITGEVSDEPSIRILHDDDLAIVLRHDGADLPPLPLAALTRQRYAPWIWTVMPVAIAVDAVMVPPLLLLAPAIIVVGD